MKYTKIFYGNQYITKFYTGRLTKWQRFCKTFSKYAKRTMLVSALVSAIGWSYAFGILTKIVTADTKIIMVVSTSTPAVMNRIAQCESGNSQIDKNGQVLIHVNSNSTFDVGRFQINSIWEKQATKLGYDLTKEKDNGAFALWLYQNYGTESWSASSKCWQ